jgi:hypothetical protein
MSDGAAAGSVTRPEQIPTRRLSHEAVCLGYESTRLKKESA